MLIFSFCAQASCAKGLSMLMPMTSAFSPENALSPALTSHISFVHTLVKASGKKSRTVFFLPRLALSLMSARPDACLDFRLKSGALVPTAIAIMMMRLVFLKFAAVYRRGSNWCQIGKVDCLHAHRKQRAGETLTA